MQPTKHLAWTFVLCCVLVCALFGVACSLDDDLGVSLRPADDPSSPPDETFCAPIVTNGHRLVAGPGGRTGSAAPGLLAAVPGGLCLLI